jgi:hypothetical protein
LPPLADGWRWAHAADLPDFREDVLEGAERFGVLRGDGSAKAHVRVSRREDGEVRGRAGDE